MDDIIKEIIEFGNTSNITEFNNTIDKMVLLFNNSDNHNNILIKDYINELKTSSYKQYIENIISKHYKNIKREQNYKNNVSNQYYTMNIILKYNNIIIKDLSSKILMKTLIISEDTIINDKKRISAYSILKAYLNNKLLKQNDVIDISNIDIICFNLIDYVACFILLLNTLYNNCFDGNIVDKINSLLFMNSNIIDINEKLLSTNYKTCIYITNSINNSCFINVMKSFNFDSLYCYFQLEELININETSYKQTILNELTPKIVFDNNIITDIDNKNCLNNYILFKCKHKPTNYFTLKHKNGNEKIFNDDNIVTNKDIIYSFNSDWLSNKQIIKNSDNNELFRDLKLFELTTKYNCEKMKILNNYNEPMFNNDIETYFNYLDIDKNILKRVSYRKIKLSDYLDYYKTNNLKTKLKYTKEGIYPLVSSVNHDNGIISFVDKYDTLCDNDNKIMSVGLRKNGRCCAFVHNYNFAHTQEVALFKLKKSSDNPEIAYVLNNNIINIYNIAFSINLYSKNNNEIKNKTDINTKDILSLEINVIYSDHT